MSQTLKFQIYPGLFLSKPQQINLCFLNCFPDDEDDDVGGDDAAPLSSGGGGAASAPRLASEVPGGRRSSSRLKDLIARRETDSKLRCEFQAAFFFWSLKEMLEGLCITLIFAF